MSKLRNLVGCSYRPKKAAMSAAGKGSVDGAHRMLGFGYKICNSLYKHGVIGAQVIGNKKPAGAG